MVENKFARISHIRQFQESKKFILRTLQENPHLSERNNPQRSVKFRRKVVEAI